MYIFRFFTSLSTKFSRFSCSDFSSYFADGRRLRAYYQRFAFQTSVCMFIVYTHRDSSGIVICAQCFVLQRLDRLASCNLALSLLSTVQPDNRTAQHCIELDRTFHPYIIHHNQYICKASAPAFMIKPKPLSCFRKKVSRF